MRILLVGAFAYPHHQGSQVYFQEQAIALRAAGAEVELLTYASPGPGSGRAGDDPNRWRALDGFLHHTAPAWSAPKSAASGPNLGKPLGDFGLGMTLHDAIASRTEINQPYQVIMTHNIEACVISLLHRMTQLRETPPVIYCVHTLMQHELSAYANSLRNKRNSNHPSLIESTKHRVKRVIDATGGKADAWAARHADGWIALTQSSTRVMRTHSNQPGALIPPPIPDPRRPAAMPGASELREPSERPPQGDYFLYSGNLDAYQELGLLGEAVARLAPERVRRVPILVASHDESVRRPGALPPGLEAVSVKSEDEMQALIAGARATLVMRRAEGGFPIKLGNSLACGTPPITLLGAEWGLTHGIDAYVADPTRPVESLATALAEVSEDQDLARRLGAGARRLWFERHRPEIAAAETVSLVEKVVRNAG